MVDIIKNLEFKYPLQVDITKETKYEKFITAKSLHKRDNLRRYVLLLFMSLMIFGQDK